MRRALTMCAAAAAVMTLAGGRSEAAPGAQAVRAGDLAVQLARAAGVNLPAGNPEKRAATFLAARGITLASTPDTPLSTGDLVLIARSLGVTVTAAAPGAAVTPAQAVAFVGAVRGTLRSDSQGSDAAAATGADTEGDITASCRGREARAGRKGTPASPADPNATAPPSDDDCEPQP